MEEIRIFHGNVVFSKSEKELEEYEAVYVVVKDGVVEGIYKDLPDRFFGLPVTDHGEDVIIPAFSDLHTHAPQYPQRGLKTDALLCDWLNRYTFPLEGRYADEEFACAVYDAFAEELIRQGTMHAVAFGTIHSRSAGYLIERLLEKGLSGFVGKVNMDQDCPAYLCEKTEDSLYETEKFLERFSGEKAVRPILTPRFAPTCSDKLLSGLGKLAKKYGVGVQTHLVESVWEKEEAQRKHPGRVCDTEIYEKAGLLGYGPFIGAHFIFPSDKDIEIFTRYGGYAAHCPEATVNVIAGIMPASDLLTKEVRIGFGSDVSAGQSLSVYSQVAASVRLSKIKSFYESAYAPITFNQAFFAATKCGGSLFGKVGSLEPGYRFDALVIGGLSDPFMPLRPIETVERFCYAGGPDNIRARYLSGKERTFYRRPGV